MSRVFHIVALGPPGSGKTTYLAALHHELVTREIADGVRFSTNALHDSTELDAIYEQMISPDPSWPAGTKADAPMREFTFSCKVEHKFKGFLGRETVHSYPAMDFVYVDYAGEWIPEAHLHPDQSARFAARLDEADVLLGILDGRKLLAQLQRTDGDGHYWKTELDPIIRQMEARSSCPAHMVITKWDLFERQGWTLDAVRQRLLAEAPTFLRFAELRSPRRLLGRINARSRLIPVSTVGWFALPTTDGVMAKDPAAVPQPLNVSLPLAAGLVDANERQMAELKRAETAARAERRRSRRDRAKGELDVGAGPVKLDAGQVFAFAFGVADGAVGVGVAASRASQRRYRRLRSVELRRVRSAEAARFYLGRTFRAMTRDFQLDPRFAGEEVAVPVGDTHEGATSGA